MADFPQTASFVQRVLQAHPHKFGAILERQEEFRFQVLLSEVRHGVHGQPVVIRHGYRTDAEYFYPASAIKVCAAISALQKLSGLRQLSSGATEIAPDTPLAFCPLFPGDKRNVVDVSNQNGKKITLVHEIRKLFLVSDNVAFNRLYSFVGHRHLNEGMWAMGFSSVRLQHRLAVAAAPEDNRRCEPVEVAAGQEGSFCLPPRMSHVAMPRGCHVGGLHVGTAYIDEEGTRVDSPMDFSGKNRMSLRELQDLLVKLLRPDIHIGGGKVELEESQRRLLLEAMVEYPSQSRNPKYSSKEYPDDYCKFFLPGLCRVRPKESLRVYNKIGQAYGFTVDNAYILDIETGREFFLSVVLYTNSNAVLNDDKYEYDTAYRVAADLAEVMARAVWQYPPDQSLSATCLDCIPSSFWPGGDITGNDVPWDANADVNIAATGDREGELLEGGGSQQMDVFFDSREVMEESDHGCQNREPSGGEAAAGTGSSLEPKGGSEGGEGSSKRGVEHEEAADAVESLTLSTVSLKIPKPSSPLPCYKYFVEG